MTGPAYESGLTEIGEAMRALRAASDMLARQADEPITSVIDAMTALEAARAARTHVGNAIVMLTEHALHLGASPQSLGFAPFEKLA